MSDRLFDIEEYPEVPILRPPRARKSEGDARFRGEYPPEWDRCPSCHGEGVAVGGAMRCSRCKGMGSLKARVRLEARHRCLRCWHPYVPKGDAKMLGVLPSGYRPIEDAKVADLPWNDGWSPCDESCRHEGPVRVLASPTVGWEEFVGPVPASFARKGVRVEAAWRILTVHHLTGDKSDCRWGNLVALCQVCHLYVQHKVVMERVYPFEHSDWFKPHAAWWYALTYLGEDLSREEVEARMDELLALERQA